MKICDFLSADATTVNLKSQKKEDVIEELVNLFIKAGTIDKKHKKRIIEVLLAREALGATAVGQGIAIPHGKCEFVDHLVGAIGISKEGIDFDSLDGEPAYLFFVLIAPMDSAGPHLKALARISRLLKDKCIRDSLKAAQDENTLFEIIQREDKEISKL